MHRENVLLRTVLYLHSRLERGLRRSGAPLTLAQYRLLFMIQEGPARSVELAAASGLAKPSVSAQLVHLEEHGWIERTGLKHDKRASSIRITAAGRTVLRDFESALNALLEDFLGTAAVARSNRELRWLFDLWTARRDEAHTAWALRQADDSPGGE